MFKELKEYWAELDKLERLMVMIFLPLTIPLGIAYGLFLVFWNKYGLAFICGLAIIKENDNPDVVWEKAQALAALIGFLLLIVRAYKETKKEKNDI